MTLDELLQRMGACNRMREAYVDFCDDSIERAAFYVLDRHVNEDGGCIGFGGHGWFWMLEHLDGLSYGELSTVAEAVERSEPMLRPRIGWGFHDRRADAMRMFRNKVTSLVNRHWDRWRRCMGRTG